MKVRAALGVLPALLGLSCSTATVDGALLALVDFGAGTTAKCVQVVVRTAEGTEVRSGPVVTDRTRPLKVGIARAGLPDQVIVYAVGYSDARCLTSAVPPERSEDGEGTFKPGRTSTVALTLIRRPNQRDDDGDGYPSAISGGDDCDDTDPGVHPGALEACGDNKDNDCDRATDCEEAGCADKACGPIIGARCRPPQCAEQLCNDDADNDGDGLRDCADSDCAGQPCRNGGTCQGTSCQGASTEKDLCSDGADNDGDQQIDCNDPDCAGSLCNPGDLCLTGARCDNNQACVNGVPVSCTSPPGLCLQAVGSCNPGDGGCTYGPDPGKPCSDGSGCTESDACSDAGTCVGIPKVCAAPAACLRPAGCAADAGCMFEPAAGAPCDDGNACTLADACQLDASCGGNLISCVPSACQVFNNQCTADAGCRFDPKDAGGSCDGGVCNGGGACIPLFPYPPSNFTESMLPTPGGPTTLGCSVVLDSHLADGGVGFNGWCGNPAPPYRLVAQAGGVGEAVLVSFSDLEVGVDASVRLQGDRPVIFAATGSVRVLGEVLASAGSSACADGGAGGAQTGNKGGGGGAYGSVAGGGGNTGGAAGIVNGEPLLIPLRGGCPGGGGTRGGGALQLSAAGNLSITGTVAAAGSGGAGGPNPNNGGKGAGSGGGVLLEGLFVLVGPTGAVTANGGSGGEGGGLVFDGESGVSGQLRTADFAPGGSSANGGASGGNGAAGTTAATAGGDSAFAGGGGGAGVGRVRINSVTPCSIGGGSVLSPKPTSNHDAGCF
ncbi:MAG: putative lipoprotein [Myxococcaceae bacterium]|nr:putative lipoprotein [Myxococcaceae bacterium]